MDSLKVRLTEVQPAPPPQPLKLLGSLFVDVNRLVRVHSRFTGEIADLGTIEAPNEPSETPEASTSLGEPVKRRPLRFGDTVKKGQLLAVVWSREVGEKKSELVDAMSRLNLHAATLQRLQKLEKGVVSERVMREAESDYELDVIAVERAERTLRSWRLPEREIEKVRAEAERIRQHKLESDPALDRSWAEIEIHSPIDGVVLEKNVAMGDIVDSSLELFKIADLSKLSVFASVYEDDLPLIVALPPASRRWMIQFNSNPEAPPVAGTFDLIGDIIDANQHTDSIIGRVDNPGRELRIGQFVTVTVPFPQVAGEVAVPSSALIEDGQASTIFVASNPERTHFTRRNVLVSRRTADHVCIRSRPTPAELAAGAQPLDVGDWVVTSGVVELASTLKTLKSMHPEAALSQSEKATPKPAGNPGG
jgi:cobalt-zinc-cadmium efflux system membrane fusion protein